MDPNNDPLTMVNVNKPCLQVKHADLELLSDNSVYKCLCPACDRGMLLVGRHHETFMLLSIDRCILCGQQFEYIDIPNGTLMALPPREVKM